MEAHDGGLREDASERPEAGERTHRSALREEADRGRGLGDGVRGSSAAAASNCRCAETRRRSVQSARP